MYQEHKYVTGNYIIYLNFSKMEHTEAASMYNPLQDEIDFNLYILHEIKMNVPIKYKNLLNCIFHGDNDD